MLLHHMHKLLRISFLIALLGWSETIPAQEMPSWLVEAYAVKIPEVDLTDKVAKHRIFGAARQWPDHWTARGLVGNKAPSVRDNPQLKSLPEYKDFVAGKQRLPRPTLDEHGGGYWPLLIRLRAPKSGQPTETLACLFRTGAIHLGPGGNIAIAFSHDRGKTWTEPAVAVPRDKQLKLDYRHGSFGQARNGDLLVMYWVSAGWNWDLQKTGEPDFLATELVRSPDLGKTWSKPQDLNLREKLGFGVGPFGPIQQVGKDALVVNVREGASDQSFLAWSFDDGRTWPKITTISTNRKTETWVLPLTHQEWIGYARAGAGGAWICRSHDGGLTFPEWQEVKPYRRRVPGCLLKLSGNRVAIIHTYRQYPFGIRAFLSHDGGKTFDFQRSYVLCDSFWMEDCGYPSAVALDDGTVLVATYATKDREHPEWGTCAMLLTFNDAIFEPAPDDKTPTAK